MNRAGADRRIAGKTRKLDPAGAGDWRRLACAVKSRYNLLLVSKRLKVK
jgi:hypothetical protein